MVIHTWEDLKGRIKEIEGRGYRAYRRVEGAYRLIPGVIFYLDRAQADPFATPSRVRLKISMEKSLYPSHLYSSPVRKMALENFILKRFSRLIHRLSHRRGSGNSGVFKAFGGRQEILFRSGCEITKDCLEIRFLLGLPAEGRRVRGKEFITMLESLRRTIPHIYYPALSDREVEEFVNLVEDVEFIRGLLEKKGLVCFIRENSLLPRRSGVDKRPLENGVPFRSPSSLRVRFPTLHHGEVEGMGIPRGITLIVGGGFHGKTTLLNAIEEGIYPHIPGDGREWVITHPDAVKVRSEDGRYVEGVDISLFINNLPQKKDTRFFSTSLASGSTSLAASIVEALEMGAKVLLLDEDTCATNFLIRDARMQKLVERDKEPIIPLVDRARFLWDTLGVSIILVLGGSGDYLDVADTVIGMEEYIPHDLTRKAKDICKNLPTSRICEDIESLPTIGERRVKEDTFLSYLKGERKVRSRGKDKILLGREVIDISQVEQIVDETQTLCIGRIIDYYARKWSRIGCPLRESIEKILEEIKDRGFTILTGYPSPDLSLPRKYEVASAFNRWRSLKVERVR